MLINKMEQYFKEVVLPTILEDNFDYCEFLSYDEYNYDYSLNEIEEASEYLKYLIIKYLLENYNGEYYLCENENIVIWKTNFAREKMGIYFHEEKIINKENFEDYIDGR